MKFKNSTILFIIGLGLIFCNHAEAAGLKFRKDFEQIGAGDKFQVSLILGTEGETINSIECVILYSNQMKLSDISDGNSIINLWVLKPSLENSDKGEINFAGLIPGGIQISEGTIITLDFLNLTSGEASISLKGCKVYQNDPNASEAIVNVQNLFFSIRPERTRSEKSPKLIMDFSPPDEFEIYLFRDKYIYDNFWFLSFNAQDKGSGISYYEIKENFLNLFGKWQKGDSPYRLSNQSLFSIIEVKAVDKVGRERIVRLIPLQFRVLCFILGLMVLFLLFLLAFKFYKNHKRKI